jgi:hypothetical protein
MTLAIDWGIIPADITKIRGWDEGSGDSVLSVGRGGYDFRFTNYD